MITLKIEISRQCSQGLGIAKGETMRATTGLAWRMLGFAAFGATAVLAVIFSSHAPVGARLTSAGKPNGVPACAQSSVRVWVAPHRLEFTNPSAAACELTGYPTVATGIAAAAVGRLIEPPVVVTLRQGATAHAEVRMRASGCQRQVTIAGLRVGLPGQLATSYVRYRARGCSVNIGAIQPGRA
jgi:hypothetical protein